MPNSKSSKSSNTGNKKTNLVWMDLEMTGLDPEVNTILEIATLITSADLDIIAEGPVIAVHQSDAVLNAMDEWNTNCHRETGLTARVQKSDIPMEEAEKMTLHFIRDHVDEKASPLCGNTIWQDRRFLLKYMPELENFFHYRNIDVSSIKEICTRWYPDLPMFEKQKVHTAIKDIQESIGELRYYRSRIFIP